MIFNSRIKKKKKCVPGEWAVNQNLKNEHFFPDRVWIKMYLGWDKWVYFFINTNIFRKIYLTHIVVQLLSRVWDINPPQLHGLFDRIKL